MNDVRTVEQKQIKTFEFKAYSIFKETWFQFSTALPSLTESLKPSIQSDNKLTIVDQVIVLGAPVGTHWNCFWGE